MQAVSISQFRRNIKKYLDEVTRSNDILIVPGNSEDDAVVIMPLKDYNSLTEPLRYDLKGFWLRRISGEHRLVYKIEGIKGVDQRCFIIQCRFHDD